MGPAYKRTAIFDENLKKDWLEPWTGSQQSIPRAEQSGLPKLTAATQSASLCARMKS
jgi:hypothetical protein